MNDTGESPRPDDSDGVSELLTSILGARISADEMRLAFLAINTLPCKDCHSVTARAICLATQFSPTHGKDTAIMVAAVDWRFQALNRIAEHPQFRAWSPDLEDIERTDPTIFAVAADEPLIALGDEWGFDPDSFFKRLLGLTEGHGHA